MRNLLMDFRYSLRSILKNPGFFLVAILTIAIAIGATTSIFSVVNVVLIKPLPFHKGENLVYLWGINSQRGYEYDLVSYPDLDEWRSQNQVFEGMAATTDGSMILSGSGDPEDLRSYFYEPEVFSVLGVKPILGRAFTKEDARPGSGQVVVLSDQLWKRRFGSDPNIVGKKLILNDKPHEVVGVMPPEFALPQGTEIWEPLVREKEMNQRSTRFLRVIARLKPGIDRERAQADMNTIVARQQKQYPDTNKDLGVRIVSFRDNFTGDIRVPLMILLFGVSFLLLIACANVANLMLVRSTGRQKEISVRMALGAGKSQLLRQLLTESLVISIIGGIAGIAFALWSTNLLVAIFPTEVANLDIPPVKDIPIDGIVLLFATCMTFLTAAIFGLAPALQSFRPRISQTLQESGSARTTESGNVFRNSLVIGEVALALMLLAGAGLLLKSFLTLQSQNLGFHTQDIMTLQVMLPRSRYPEMPKRIEFVKQVLERMRSLPGIRSAGATNYLPLTGFYGPVNVKAQGHVYQPREEPVADDRVITSGYFQTMGMSIVKGRNFTPQDDHAGSRVVIINQILAKRLFGTGDPIGKRINLDNEIDSGEREIVGVVADVKSFGMEKETHLEVFRPYSHLPYRLIAFTAKTDGDPSKYAAMLREQILAVDKDQPIFQMISMTDLAADSLTLRRVSMQLIVSLAALALLLSGIGIYGVISYAVSKRTHEIGIRVTLGAAKSDVLRMILRQGLVLASAGLSIGLLGAFAITRLISSFLYGVSAKDPAVFGAISLTVLAIALIACVLPARRAMKVDPIVALRYE